MRARGQWCRAIPSRLAGTWVGAFGILVAACGGREGSQSLSIPDWAATDAGASGVGGASGDAGASADAGVSGDAGALGDADRFPLEAEPEVALDDPFDRPCTAVCGKMLGLVFPLTFCDDLGAGREGAYFCRRDASRSDDTCTSFCRRALAMSPNARCRAAWVPVMSCIEERTSYGDFVLGAALSESCQASLFEMKSACWSEGALDRQRLDYAYLYDQGGEDTVQLTGLAVTVWDGVASAPGGPDVVPSIDDLFGALAACMATRGESAIIEYDPIYGFPSSGACVRSDSLSRYPFDFLRWRTYGIREFRTP
jgi:hypothetical protein